LEAEGDDSKTEREIQNSEVEPESRECKKALWATMSIDEKHSRIKTLLSEVASAAEDDEHWVEDVRCVVDKRSNSMLRVVSDLGGGFTESWTDWDNQQKRRFLKMVMFSGDYLARYDDSFLQDMRTVIDRRWDDLCSILDDIDDIELERESSNETVGAPVVTTPTVTLPARDAEDREDKDASPNGWPREEDYDSFPEWLRAFSKHIERLRHTPWTTTLEWSERQSNILAAESFLNDRMSEPQTRYLYSLPSAIAGGKFGVSEDADRKNKAVEGLERIISGLKWVCALASPLTRRHPRDI
jgi:hypothetical protein